MRKAAIILILILCVMSMFSQEFAITKLPTQKQLPVANVHAIMQDSEGYMWYATREGGLCRDIGYAVNVFRSDRNHPALIGSSNDILSVTEDKSKRIVFTTQDGAYVLDKKDYGITVLDSKLKGKRADVAYGAQDGTIWVSCGHSVYHYDRMLRCLGVYPVLWKGRKAYVTQFYEDSKGRLWATEWDGGLVIFDKKANRFTPQEWLDGVTPGRIVEDRVSHCFWVSTWGKGIFKYIPEKHLIEQQKASVHDNVLSVQIMDMKIDAGHRRLWASTMSGLFGYNIISGKLQPVYMGGLLPQGISVIDGLDIDNNGNLWVAGFSPLTFILSQKDDGITTLDINSSARNEHASVWNTVREGNLLWIGQERLGISVYDLRNRKTAYASESGDLKYIETDMSWFCKCSERQGVWCFLEKELYWLRFADGQFIRERMARTDEKIKCLYDDGRGNVYIGTANGIDVYTKGGQLRHVVSNTGSVTDIVKGKDNTLYFASARLGLASRQLGKARSLSALGSFTSLAKDRHGNIYAADRQGDLVVVDHMTGKVTVDNVGSNANGDAIKNIAIDATGHLWLVSDQYLKEYNPKSGACRLYYCYDKNISMDNMSSVSADGSNAFVSGSGTGMVLKIASTKALDNKWSRAKAYITSVSIDNKDHIIGLGEDKIRIRPNEVSVTFQFSTLNYLNTGKVVYAYRLKGLDGNWYYLPAGENKATFFKLRKGNYTLEVKATDEYGRWSNAVTALKVYRIPAWYESWLAYCVYVLLGILAIGYAIHRYLLVQRTRQHRKMEEELTELKFRFFTNVSHELRTPLTLIVTPLQSLLKKLSAWGEAEPENARIGKVRSQVALVNDNANRLLQLVNKLLDFRKLENGEMKLELATGDVFEFIRSVCDTFRPMSQEKGTGLGYAIPNKSLYMYFDAEKLRLILTNLLSNAFKFTKEGGSIVVTVSAADSKLKIAVKDNGCGISPGDISHVFDRYYQGKQKGSSVTGTGIGLNMVQEFVRLHKGAITVESKVGKGTTFTVALPTDLRPETALPGQKNAPDTAQANDKPVEQPTGHDRQSPKILVVDDNDEFRQFLVGELSDSYNVLQASNGEDALKLVSQHDVDLVISDVMMPGMDGLELCRRIKHDVSTSHIMVILLTARSADENKMEGLRSGTDDYLSKPFNMEMLQLRIAHLIELRNSRIKKFVEGTEVKVDEVAPNEVDRKFLRDAMSVVEKNMLNDDYSVEAFCSDLFMSRSTCYRKLQSLTGQKPSEFIRTIRLKHAAKLIKGSKYTVSEVSDMCGFSSVSYFSRSFKEMFGANPTEYQKGQG